VLSDPFERYLDGAGYVDPGTLGSRSRPPVTTAQAEFAARTLVPFFWAPTLPRKLYWGSI
jgi:hypothetical protein